MRFLALLVTLAAANAAPAAPPNVVFILGDDQAWGDYGFMGHPHIRTPNIDRLAAESLTFPHGTVPTSLCRASLATMITGLYPHQHKITSNDPPIPPGRTGANAARDPRWLKDRAAMVTLFEQSPNLAKLLGDDGFVTFQAGKWWEGNACRCGGFTEGMTVGDPLTGGRHGDIGLQIGRQGEKPVFDFLDAAKKAGKPFFVWYAPMMPHQPHNPPARLLAHYKPLTTSLHVAKYWAMCEWFDETVGEVLKHLDETGLAKDTIVVYLHDNGWIQDPNGPSYDPRSKRSPYEGGVRTPILVRWPGHVTPAKSDALVSSIDLAPTVLAAVGLKPTPAMPGVNLLDPKAVAAREAVYGEIFEHNAIDINAPATNLTYRWVVDGQWKLIEPNPARVPKGKEELYDLAADPNETKNLATAQPKRVAELRAKLNAWWPGK
jgi:arylsulfatase A-like enzyme